MNRNHRIASSGTALLVVLLVGFSPQSSHVLVAGAAGTAASFRRRLTSKTISQLPWTAERFPDPEDPKCRSGTSLRFCDPDAILTDRNDLESLGQALESSLTRRVALPQTCTSSSSMRDNINDAYETNTVEVQFAVALVYRMDLAKSPSNPEKAAELLARQVHDKWGVGMDTECGGTGILLFLSDRDRTIYISRGSALESVLTDRRLDRTIEHMKPLLKKEQYALAILGALQELDEYLVAGEPRWTERVSDFIVAYLGYAWILAIFGFLGRSIMKEQKERRDYAKVSSQLNEMDQARAEALQGRFRSKSCPICLEDFTAADEQENSKECDPAILKGSDGLPLKLLRCGHVYCDSCFSEWVCAGHHNKVDKCPICQQDIGGDGNKTHESSGNTATDQQDENRNSEEDAQNRAYRQYTRDRNFRLMRLNRRYPNFVRPQQVERWTSVGYDGCLARDPTFVSSDPVIRTSSSRSSGSGRSGGSRSGGTRFGGGSSGGGRGGRW